MVDFVTKGLSSRLAMIISPLFVLAVLGVFLWQVDLRPQITPDFFFSTDSEIYKQDKRIADEFPFQQQILLNVTTAGSIADPNYHEKIDTLTQRILSVQGVSDVNSITRGPDDLEAARENPLWRRMLFCQLSVHLLVRPEFR